MKPHLLHRCGASLGILIGIICLTAAPGWGQEPKLKDLPPEVSGQQGQIKKSAGDAEPPGKTEQSVSPTDGHEGRTESEGGEPEAPQTRHPLMFPVDLLREHSQRILDRITSENGNNETAIVGRFQLQTEYRDRDGSQAQWRNVARVDLPIGKRFLIRTDVPFYYAKFQTSDPSNTWASGVGDIFVRMGALVYDTPELKLFIGGDVIFPTASEDELGKSKYSLGPGFAISAPVPEWGVMLFWRFQQITSVGGDPSKADVDLTRLRFRFAKPLSANWWVHAEPEVRIDWTNGAKTAVLSQFEIGRRMDEHWRLFMRPAIGISGNDVPGAYDWFVRFGVRYMF